MKVVLLLVLTIFMTIIIVACQSVAYDDGYAGSVLISRHPSQLGTETPLNIYSLHLYSGSFYSQSMVAYKVF